MSLVTMWDKFDEMINRWIFNLLDKADKKRKSWRFLHTFFKYDADEVKKLFDRGGIARSTTLGNLLISNENSNLLTIPFNDRHYQIIRGVVEHHLNEKTLPDRFVTRAVSLLNPYRLEQTINISGVLYPLFIKTFLYEGLGLSDVDVKRYMNETSGRTVIFPGRFSTLFLLRFKIIKDIYFRLPRNRKLVEDRKFLSELYIDLFKTATISEKSWLHDYRKLYQEGKIQERHICGAFDDIQITVSIMTLMTSMVLYELGKDRKMQSRARDDLLYARWCWQETLRKNVATSYIFYEDTKKKKCPFGFSELNCVSLKSIHHNEEHYPNPEKFDPMRFSDGLKELQGKWIPFGGGERICPGRAVSMKIGPRLLQEILRKYDVNTTTEFSSVLKVITMPKHDFIPLSLTPITNIDVLDDYQH